tara:strand:- start:19 stop:519 length:501 start_codon:yes stop_codon:yes gene_type:complete
MIQIINSYSFIIVEFLILAGITFISWRILGLKWTVPVITATLIILTTSQFILSTKTNTISNPEDFDNVLKLKQPVLVELYSNFCVACLSSKPKVDHLELDLEGEFLVVRLDLNSDVGKYVRQKYDGGLVPTFIVFNRGGDLVWKINGKVPTAKKILSLDLQDPSQP